MKTIVITNIHTTTVGVQVIKHLMELDSVINCTLDKKLEKGLNQNLKVGKTIGIMLKNKRIIFTTSKHYENFPASHTKLIDAGVFLNDKDVDLYADTEVEEIKVVPPSEKVEVHPIPGEVSSSNPSAPKQEPFALDTKASTMPVNHDSKDTVTVSMPSNRREAEAIANQIALKKKQDLQKEAQAKTDEPPAQTKKPRKKTWSKKRKDLMTIIETAGAKVEGQEYAFLETEQLQSLVNMLSGETSE